jgi:membrane protease YdiL (CAAX protease family)
VTPDDAQQRPPASPASGGATSDEAGSPHGPGEALALFGAGLLASALLAAPAVAERLGPTLVPALFVLAWLLPAWLLAERRGRDPLVAHHLAVRPRGVGVAALVSAAVLLLYALAWAGVARWQGWTAAPRAGGDVARDALWVLAWGGLLIALPEEWFFRGVLQPALDGPGGVRVLGARLGRGALAAALLFGLAHAVVDLAAGRGLHAVRLATVFPALWFAWLRARTGSVLVPAAAHAAADAVDRACRLTWSA